MTTEETITSALSRVVDRAVEDAAHCHDTECSAHTVIGAGWHGAELQTLVIANVPVFVALLAAELEEQYRRAKDTLYG